ncbi:MAG: DUF167 domain-containing protein [Pseudomonadales bacterium]|nr:DUF167 domain-containing protein [Pseudomonadales bacterium]
MDKPLRKSGNRLLLECSVIPKSREEKITGLMAGTVKVKLTAAPTDGKANKQLIAVLAREFDLKPADISLVRGASSRRKTLSLPARTRLPDWLADTMNDQEKE